MPRVGPGTARVGAVHRTVRWQVPSALAGEHGECRACARNACVCRGCGGASCWFGRHGCRLHNCPISPCWRRRQAGAWPGRAGRVAVAAPAPRAVRAPVDRGVPQPPDVAVAGQRSCCCHGPAAAAAAAAGPWRPPWPWPWRQPRRLPPAAAAPMEASRRCGHLPWRQPAAGRSAMRKPPTCGFLGGTSAMRLPCNRPCALAATARCAAAAVRCSRARCWCACQRADSFCCSSRSRRAASCPFWATSGADLWAAHRHACHHGALRSQARQPAQETPGAAAAAAVRAGAAARLGQRRLVAGHARAAAAVCKGQALGAGRRGLQGWRVIGNDACPPCRGKGELECMAGAGLGQPPLEQRIRKPPEEAHSARHSRVGGQGDGGRVAGRMDLIAASGTRGLGRGKPGARGGSTMQGRGFTAGKQ